MVNLRIVIKLRNKSASQIMAATGQAIGIWKGFGVSPKIISWDQEPAMVASSEYGVNLDFTLLEGIIRDTVTLLNFLPTANVTPPYVEVIIWYSNTLCGVLIFVTILCVKHVDRMLNTVMCWI